MAKKQQVKTVKEPTLPEKITKFIQTNYRTLVIGFVAFTLAGFAVVGFGAFQKNKEKKVEASLFSERSVLTNLLKQDPKAKENPSFDMIQAAAKNLETKILSHSGSSAAVTSALELGGIYLDYKKFDLAKALLTKLSPEKGILSSLVSQQLATTLLEMNDFKGAIAQLDKVTTSKANKFQHPDALIKKGLAYREMGDLEKAKASFQQVAEEYSGKPIANTANKYLRVLNFKQK